MPNNFTAGSRLVEAGGCTLLIGLGTSCANQTPECLRCFSASAVPLGIEYRPDTLFLSAGCQSSPYSDEPRAIELSKRLKVP